MIICCIALGLIILGGLGLIISKIIFEFTSGIAPDWFDCTSGCCLIIGVIAAVILTGPILGVQLNKELDYQNVVEERAALVAGIELLENSDLVAANVSIYSDVAKFNASLRKTKRWSDNPWVNLFYNDLIAENVDYIPLDGGT